MLRIPNKQKDEPLIPHNTWYIRWSYEVCTDLFELEGKYYVIDNGYISFFYINSLPNS